MTTEIEETSTPKVVNWDVAEERDLEKFKVEVDELKDKMMALESKAVLLRSKLDKKVQLSEGNASSVPEEKKEKKKGKKEKKKGKTKEKKGKTKEKKKKDPPWTEDANIPESVVTAMVALVQEPEVTKQIKVHLPPLSHHHLFGVARGIRLLAKQENMNYSYMEAFIREVQKGIAEVNKEKLYEGDDHEDRLQVMRDEICPPIGDSPPNDEIIARFRHKAIELNVTTTDLGRALAGSSYIKSAIDERNRNTSDVTHLPDTDDCDNRRLIAKATVLCSHDDYITGYTCKSRDTGHVVEAQEHARRLHDRSRRGENRLVEDLRKAGHPPNSYKTEAQLTKDVVPEATPDVLFDELQIIRGKQVNWIDAKNAGDIPGVTPERVMEALRRQVEKYVERFGPGAILWTKCGFCKDVLSGVKGVSHFRPNANSHGQPSREQQAGPSRSSVPDERDPVGRLGPRQAFAAQGSATAAEAHELIDRLGHEGVQEYGILHFTELQKDLAPFFTYVQQRERRGQTTGGTQVTSVEDMREHRLRVFDQ